MTAPPIISTNRPRTAGWLIILAPLLVIGVVLYLFNPAQHSFYPQCLLFKMTGIYCPGCGSLRALHQLTHGHLLTALHFNPLLVLALPALAAWFLHRLWLEWTGRPAPAFALNSRWLVVVTIILVLFTVLRNIPCAPFTWLAPPPAVEETIPRPAD